MFDLHSHSILSDGELLPSELARRAEEMGLKGLVISDHVDASNVDFVVPRLAEVSRQLSVAMKLIVKPGAELTHIMPSELLGLVERARELGAELVLVHGETIVEPVMPGTNRAGIESGADILTHPGLISEKDAELAAKLGVGLEISARKGHSLTNGHVAKVARKTGAVLVFGSDSHAPGDLMDMTRAEKVAMGAGLEPDEVRKLFTETERMFHGRKESLRR
ncbi:MAG TPA: histidinol phosphate phosphatase domain-containing protein [Candidatus Avalokitesvara rifleensis]|uniref:histidinol phosphate phosphatase domain-containing protein n=1 Tax=Candidatus Avalokitesvara rifleensis TaxID=3367620 RepID=UPI0027127549|nr:histidinol phosphate phosphatase domain-containing protein [Candidatus Brocadiales bacterium]